MMESPQWPTKYQQSAVGAAAAAAGIAESSPDDSLHDGNDGDHATDDTSADTAAAEDNADNKKQQNGAFNEQHKEPLNAGISENAKQRIPLILEHMKSLSNTEKYLLYLKLSQDTNVVDPLRQPLNPLGSRSEINRTISWIKTHLEEDPDISLPKQQVYEEYSNYCEQNQIKALSQADFGKVMKQVYPKVRARRLGTRGHSRYCYSGLKRCIQLKTPILPDLSDKVLSTETPCTQASLAAASWLIVKEWCEQHFSSQFTSLQSLAYHLIINYSVGVGSDAAHQLTSASDLTQVKGAPKSGGSKHREMQIQLQKKIQQKNEVKERKRKMQQSPMKCSQKKSKQRSPTPSLCCSTGDTTSLSSTGGSTSTSPTAQGKIDCDNKSSLDFTPQQQQQQQQQTSSSSSSSLPDFKSFQKPVVSEKVAIPKLSCSNNNINSNSKDSSILTCPLSRKAKSNKYKAIQPKPQPCDIASYKPQPQSVETNRSQGLNNVDRINQDDAQQQQQQQTNGFPPLPRARLDSISNVDKDAMDEYLGTNNSQHEEELSKYFNTTEQEAKLSQLRMLLEQNGIQDGGGQGETIAPMPPVMSSSYIAPLLIQNHAPSGGHARRRVSFETPTLPLTGGGGGGGVGDEPPVPPSPNTRRKNFSFTPISPQSPNNNNNSNGVQSKCSSANASPFVSPRNTPVPRTKGKIKREPDLFVEIPTKYSPMSAPASPMLHKLLNSNSKVSYTPDYVTNPLMAIKPEVVDAAELTFRSQSVPLNHMTKSTDFLLDPPFLATLPLSLANEQHPNNDFNDFESLQQETATTVGQIIDSLDEQQFSSVPLPDFGLIVNQSFDLGEPAQRCFGRSQSIDVNPVGGCYDTKCHPSRSVPNTPLPYRSTVSKNSYVTSATSSRSYPSTPLLVNESPFTYNLNGDCLLNGQPIQTNTKCTVSTTTTGGDITLSSYYCEMNENLVQTTAAAGGGGVCGSDSTPDVVVTNNTEETYGNQFDIVDNHDAAPLMDDNDVLITEIYTNGTLSS